MALSCQQPTSSYPHHHHSLVHPEWELIDPSPDVHALFLQFNDRFFYGRLAACEVRWSPGMTLCAGKCVYARRAGYCSIRLSSPLLKLRPRSDLVETLLHEMIHAYLFVTDNDTDRDGHGPNFHAHMHRINADAGTNISVYHTFHAEVAAQRQHWWRCGGPCRTRQPFYGWVKRSMNRAPGKNDRWWAEHQTNCGGAFVKVKEPENYKKKSTKEQNGKRRPLGASSVKVTTGDKAKSAGEPSGSSSSAFSGTGHRLGGSVGSNKRKTDAGSSQKDTGAPCDDVSRVPLNKRKRSPVKSPNKTLLDYFSVTGDNASSSKTTEKHFHVSDSAVPSSSLKEPKHSNATPSTWNADGDIAACPACERRVLLRELNLHLDTDCPSR